MGRAKLNMELIKKEKSRINTFKKRKQGLIRKLHEFTTLCDVSACMIIYGPDQEKGPEIWPRNDDEVRRVIDIYKAKSRDNSVCSKTYGLSDFFHDRKRRIEEELAKLKKKNMEAKYPTWVECLNFMTEGGLRDFGVKLSDKIEYVRSRIEFLRRSSNYKQGVVDINLMDYYNASRLGDHLQPQINFNQVQVPNYIQYHHPTVDQQQQQQQELHSLNQDSMMMLMMNGNHYDNNSNFVQFGDVATSSSNNNIQYGGASTSFFKPEPMEYGPVGPTVFFKPEPMDYGAMAPTVIGNGQSQLARYYSPNEPVPYVPQMDFSTWENNTNNHIGGGGGDQEDVNGLIQSIVGCDEEVGYRFWGV